MFFVFVFLVRYSTGTVPYFLHQSGITRITGMGSGGSLLRPLLLLLGAVGGWAACVSVTPSHSASAPTPLPDGAAGTSGNGSSAPHAGWRFAFCGDGPASVFVPINSSNSSTGAIEAAVARQDALAARDYASMIRVLSTFDCSQKYSYYTCDQCRAYYKRWICLMRLPRCTTRPGEDQDAGEVDSPCLESCTNVLRACPYNIDFSCPSGDSLFGHDYSTEAETCDSGID